MRSILFCLAIPLVVAACDGNGTQTAEPSATLNVYTARHYDSDRLLYEAFEAETGITVRFRELSAPALIEALKTEGDASPADVVISADAGTLWQFQDAGLLQPVTSATLEAAIPARFREPDGHWFGLAKRARIIVYDPARLNAEQVGEYGDLASETLDGEICMRSSSNVYNLSLMGELIERWGEEDAQAWASAVADNFARDPQGGDTTQIESIAAGECSVAIVNHYYWARLATSEDDSRRAIAEATALAFPSTGAGTHVNITGAGIAANAPHKDEAIAFLEFLVSPEGQGLLVSETREFPIVDGVPLPTGTDTLPAFVESTLALTKLGENQAKAQMIYDRADWN